MQIAVAGIYGTRLVGGLDASGINTPDARVWIKVGYERVTHCELIVAV